ncbi:MAG: reverse transcriptase/maturase family protein [Patescibacteria group bacterium]|nr:reverse transcriptase/maturase family protein [Patescibacteria group bacterium]MDD5121727.1 reverse transcriptase/maturase family protein [Patescibacteria group bacterium]MDD5221971.1 reverse transcriptase/maturase family protein [Patescibacteria group bacterium]MDD5396109.1 reverse transcriptase/maturase family protein [Patescibacteria group bacterium]
MKIYSHLFEKIISLENLFSAWDEFRQDKKKKSDILKFEFNLEPNIFQLYRDLQNHAYKHGPYTSFFITDPKQRHIHKALVRDRVLHHAVFTVLNPIFEPTFIGHSFSCRINKGAHKAVNCLTKILRATSANHTKPCFILKCDISKFFASVDHDTLLEIVSRKIKDDKAMWLIKEIIESFCSNQSDLFKKRGLPIGNLTSQLFANIYLNEFDQFVKHELQIKKYLRYTDDFIVVANDKKYLRKILKAMKKLLEQKLFLKIHPKKIIIRKFDQGIDFLGHLLLPYYRLIKTKTKQRIMRKLRGRIKEYKNGIISEKTLEQSLQSYLGVLSHANTYKLGQYLKNQFWWWLKD